MPHAIRVHEYGGPDVLKWEEVQVGEPGPGQAKLKQHAAGVNFIDVYIREGRYKAPLPFVPGQEGAGTITAVGSEAKSVKVGDRVAWSGLLGSYAEYAAVAADRLVSIPQGVSESAPRPASWPVLPRGRF